MTSLKKNTEELVEYFQTTNNSDELLDKYKNFLNKYHQILCYGTIDFNNYDIRTFLCCYIKDKDDRSSMLRGKYHSTEDISNGYEVVKYIQQAFKGYESIEIYHELIIPFLECARRYKAMNKSFNSYLYKTYRYELMRHINSILFQRFNKLQPSSNETEVEVVLIEDMQELKLELDEDISLNHPDWLNGAKADKPFNQFTREERLILTKYYLENYTDKDIGRLVGRNRKSINRSRLRVVRKIKGDIQRGEIKWIRLLH